ncbi:MAG: phosphotransferase system enzyme I (PtsI) [Myxococcota bacterium]|jgi:phosphotransferase system enzyme I (PtsI)
MSTGVAVLLDRRRVTFAKSHIDKKQIEPEIQRLRYAISESVRQLEALNQTVMETRFSEHGKILEAHALMLQDDLLVQGSEDLILRERINAEWALQRTLLSIKDFFNNLEDEYFRDRQSDVESIGDRIMRNLTGQYAESLVELCTRIKEPTILVAHTLSPADTLQLHHTPIVAIVTEEGTKTTHTSIIARSLELPAVVGAPGVTDVICAGDLVIVDGDRGALCIRPTQRQKDEWAGRHHKVSAVRTKLSRRRKKAAITQDGFEIGLTGNIDLVEEMPAVKSRGGQGIGLFRTEYLYLNRRDIPDETEQYHAYRELLEKAAPDPATIRTLDIGGDKLDLPGSVSERMNPFFGLRAIRYCLKEQSLFRTQLRALLRASVHGKLRLLIPFITDITEVRQVKKLLKEVRHELEREGLQYAPNIELGAMIEIPSAAMISDLLAREVDFFSVGTNDLIQYTLAISRDSPDIDYLYHPLHPAVLRMLRIISDAAHNEGIRLAMCGEMAGEPLYAAVLLGFRFDELSMNPRSIPVVREIVQRMTLKGARSLVDRLMPLATYQEVEAEVYAFMIDRFPDLAPVLGGEVSRK